MTTCEVKPKRLSEWQKVIHVYAVSKGFLWKKTDIDTILLRIQSEASEAYSAYIEDNCVISPHFAEELADVAIRIFDCAEVMELNLEDLTGSKFIGGETLQVKGESTFETVLLYLLNIHHHLSCAAEFIRKNVPQRFNTELSNTFLTLTGLAYTVGVNLEAEVNRKHKINLKRPYLHGKPKMRKVSRCK